MVYKEDNKTHDKPTRHHYEFTDPMKIRIRHIDDLKTNSKKYQVD